MGSSFFAGLTQGLGSALQQHRKEGLEKQQRQQELETKLFSSLLSNPDPEVSALATTGLMESISGKNQGKSFLGRLLAKQTESPTFQALISKMQAGGQPSPAPPPEVAAGGVASPPQTPAPIQGSMEAPPAGRPPVISPAQVPVAVPPPSAAMPPAPGPSPQGVAEVQAAQQAAQVGAQQAQPQQPQQSPQGMPRPTPPPSVGGRIFPSAQEEARMQEAGKQAGHVQGGLDVYKQFGATPEELHDAAGMAIGAVPKAKPQTVYEREVDQAHLRTDLARAHGLQPNPADLMLIEADNQRKLLPKKEQISLQHQAKMEELGFSAKAAMERARLASQTTLQARHITAAAATARAAGGLQGGLSSDPQAIEDAANDVATGRRLPRELKGVNPADTAKFQNVVMHHLKETGRPVWDKKVAEKMTAFDAARGSLDAVAGKLEAYMSAADPTGFGNLGVLGVGGDKYKAYNEYDAEVKSFLTRQLARTSDNGRVAKDDAVAFENFLSIGPVGTRIDPEQAQHRLVSAQEYLDKMQARVLQGYAKRQSTGLVPPPPPGFVLDQK